MSLIYKEAISHVHEIINQKTSLARLECQAGGKDKKLAVQSAREALETYDKTAKELEEALKPSSEKPVGSDGKEATEKAKATEKAQREFLRLMEIARNTVNEKAG
jgi:hypothetical protein